MVVYKEQCRDKMGNYERRNLAHDPETKRQSAEWVGENTPRFRKLRFQNRIKMILIFFDQQGVVHKKFVKERCTINAEYYKSWSHGSPH